MSSPLSASVTFSPPVVELEEYDIVPSQMKEYMHLAAKATPVRLSHLPLRLLSFPEAGGKLNVATHLYNYSGGHPERNRQRDELAADPTWTTEASAPGVIQGIRSTLFVEAPLVAKTEGVCGLSEMELPLMQSDRGEKACIYELRRYRLRLGYDTVPKFLKLYGEGLPSKLAAEGTDPTTSLTTVLYSEVGPLNEVIELWRHGDGTAAMERSRVAARGANQWRTAISQIANLANEFTSTIHRPAPFSPWK